jgi:hypothetical protein
LDIRSKKALALQETVCKHPSQSSNQTNKKKPQREKEGEEKELGAHPMITGVPYRCCKRDVNC